MFSDSRIFQRKECISRAFAVWVGASQRWIQPIGIEQLGTCERVLHLVQFLQAEATWRRLTGSSSRALRVMNPIILRILKDTLQTLTIHRQGDSRLYRTRPPIIMKCLR